MFYVEPQSADSDIDETQPIQSTRLRVCIRSKLTWIIVTIVIIAIITIPTTITLTKKENVAETNSTTIGEESITLMLTTTTTEPSKTKTIEPLRTTTTTTTTTKPLSANLPDLISLDSIDGVIYGVHGTRINQDSQASEPGTWYDNYH
ncbi:unnamed protein product [Adineta steineri]|uniref:Uncharacterized protein n=2 Tax=Adineta steineri TaxID=433720 RepID=A0A819UJU3_9BILA|nr:unnamed protein product [Adineta steineri]